MKKFLLSIYILLGVTLLIGCQSKNGTTTYKPDVPNYNFVLDGETTLSVSDVQSGSALLNFNELDHVAYYQIKVSKSISFADNATKLINSLSNEYRLYFDDHSELYVRAQAIAQNGMSYQPSSVQKIDGKYATYIAGDEFNLGTTEGWNVKNGRISSDYHSLIVTPVIEESIVLSKNFKVTNDAEYLHVKFLTKNTESSLSVSLIYENKTYVIKQDMKQIERGYIRYDLSQLALKDKNDITIQIESHGKNTGFQLDYVKFIKESKHEGNIKFHDVEKRSSYNTLLMHDTSIEIQNIDEPLAVVTPSTEIDFNPKALPIVEIMISDYLPRDTFKLTIRNRQEEILYETETLYIKNHDGKFSVNLYEQGITKTDTYFIQYHLSNPTNKIEKMQLVGESELAYDVVYGEWVNGVSAYIDQTNLIRLNDSTIYNYGDIRKQFTVDLGETPIVFFDVESVTGAWAVKVIPEGATSDIYVVKDNSNTGKVAYDLSQILQSTGITKFTFEVFLIGKYKADPTAVLKMNPIRFGNALSIISNQSDEVVSSLSYDVGPINLNDFGFIYIDINSISKGGIWKLYIVDQSTNRRYEMRTLLEKKYPQRYFREKTGIYIYDIKAITGILGIGNLGVVIEVIGNHAHMKINDVCFTSNGNIPTGNNSAY